MHINVHVAMGIIIATIVSEFIDLNLWSFGFIIFGSIFPDFDIIFKKYAFEKNHRNLFTHSVYPSLFLILIGLLFKFPVLFISAIGYLIHIIIDTFDWGCDLFYRKQTFGLCLLLPQEERARLPSILEKYTIPQYFFVYRYYHTMWIIICESIIFGVMILMLFLITPQFGYFIVLYFIALGVHLLEYKEVKHQNGGGDRRIPLIPH